MATAISRASGIIYRPQYVTRRRYQFGWWFNQCAQSQQHWFRLLQNIWTPAARSTTQSWWIDVATGYYFTIFPLIPSIPFFHYTFYSLVDFWYSKYVFIWKKRIWTRSRKNYISSRFPNHVVLPNENKQKEFEHINNFF